MNKPCFKINQFGLDLYIVTLSVEEIIEQYTIAIYDSSTGKGYQRPPIPAHYRNIGRYLESEDPILPSAILAAVDVGHMNFKDNHINISGKIRIVDGQHRIEGFRYLQKINPARYEELKSIQFPVIIMETDPNDDHHEVNAFININSKGKKVSTDLAIRLREKNRARKNDFYKDPDSLQENIATHITLNINNSSSFPYWIGSIKTSPEESNTIISINAFNNSLRPIITAALKYHKVQGEDDASVLIGLLVNLISNAWMTIYSKWDDCFNKQELTFNKVFNIQKGIGVNSLHIILAECIEETHFDIKETQLRFESIINNSSITSESWISGGPFSGHNSLSGFKKVAEEVKRPKEAKRTEEVKETE
ncbi:DGQHR domain-containing protein [Bacillus thuringiensis]|uniref:DGQHR domain-containing protein n=1 Tax=Bacillus thuringiensis TaxID=1428 RepID=UPI0016424473|nr:DGQHR domain-containing protein [Bacillus thuringiensis]